MRKVVFALLIFLLFALTPQCLAKDLPKLYPFRACVTGTIQKIVFNKKENKCLATVLVSEVFLKDEMFETHKRIVCKDWPLGPAYANLLPKTRYQFEIYGNVNEKLGMPWRKAIGQEFLWSFNANTTSKETISIGDFPKIVLLSKVPNSRINEIKKQVFGTNEKWREIKSTLQSDIEQYWTPARITEIQNRQDTRLCPTIPASNGDGIVISGQLFPDRKKELGEITWYAIFNSEQNNCDIELRVNRGGNQIWRLYPAIGSIPPGEDDALSDLLTIIAHNTFRSFQVVHGDKYGWETPITPPGRVTKIFRHKDKTLKSFECILQNRRLLTADINDQLEISNVHLDGKPDKYWEEAFKERFDNLEKLFDR